MGQRAMVVDDVHRSALDGQRNAHLMGDGLEGVGEALEIGARGVASDAEPQAIGGAEEKREKERKTADRRAKERTAATRRTPAAGESATGGSPRSPDGSRRSAETPASSCVVSPQGGYFPAVFWSS